MPPRRKKKPTEPLLKKLGTRVRELRLEKGMSQIQLADEAGIDRAYVSAIEGGQRNVGILHVGLIAQALEVKFSDLLD